MTDGMGFTEHEWERMWESESATSTVHRSEDDDWCEDCQTDLGQGDFDNCEGCQQEAEAMEVVAEFEKGTR